MTDFIKLALECGFSCAAPLNPTDLNANSEVRAMCAQNKCHAYGKNWTCPPTCGTLEDCSRQMHARSRGLLVQTVAELEDEFDIEGMQEAEKRHMAALHRLAEQLREQYPDALCLGAGGCRICASCAYPEPCRFPQKACSSMEAYGLLINEVCKSCGLPYYHGKNTLTYTACCLY